MHEQLMKNVFFFSQAIQFSSCRVHTAMLNLNIISAITYAITLFMFAKHINVFFPRDVPQLTACSGNSRLISGRH